MVGFFSCGISSFPREDEGEHKIVPSSKVSIRRKSSGVKEDKNPYAARGLKQFCALLAEIEEKRQKIYAEVGADAISLIQFVYSDDNKCKPIVVRVKKGNKDKEVSRSPVKPDHVLGSALVVGHKTEKDRLHLKHGCRNEERSGFLHCLTLVRFRVDRCYQLPLIVILVLFLLVLFGRLAAIFCVSIGWYLVPQITSNKRSDLRNPVQKKDGVRREMEKKKKKILGAGFSSFKVKDSGEKLSPRLAHGKSLVRSHSMVELR